MELHILFGPTATSKTKLAQTLWEKTHYPILSVDSRKVYRGADIGTNKLALLEFSKSHTEVLVGGIDFLNPDEEVSVYLYQQEVFRWVEEHGEEILTAGGLIIHGGTGLYLDAILEGKTLLAPRNEKLRAELEMLSLAELQKQSETAAPTVYNLMNDSDKQNPRRLIRVIENANESGAVVSKNSSFQLPYVQEVLAKSTKKWQINIPPRDVLWPIINIRVLKYYEEGWLSEVERMLAKFGPTAPALMMMGYRQLVEFMLAHDNWRELSQANDHTFQQVTQQIQLIHRQYAKRQETWAKKYTRND